MAEWHITPDYIVNNWTDELFNLMCEKLSERKKLECGTRPKVKKDVELVSDTELFRQMGIKVKHGN